MNMNIRKYEAEKAKDEKTLEDTINALAKEVKKEDKDVTEKVTSTEIMIQDSLKK